MSSGRSEAAVAPAGAGGKIRNQLKSDLHNRHEQQLRNSFAGLNKIVIVSVIMQNHADFAMIIRIDDPQTLADPNLTVQAQAASAGDDRDQAGVLDVYRQTGTDQLVAAAGQDDRRIDTGNQINPGGPRGFIGRHAVLFQQRIDDSGFD